LALKAKVITYVNKSFLLASANKVALNLEEVCARLSRT